MKQRRSSSQNVCGLLQRDTLLIRGNYTLHTTQNVPAYPKKQTRDRLKRTKGPVCLILQTNFPFKAVLVVSLFITRMEISQQRCHLIYFFLFWSIFLRSKWKPWKKNSSDQKDKYFSKLCQQVSVVKSSFLWLNASLSQLLVCLSSSSLNSPSVHFTSILFFHISSLLTGLFFASHFHPRYRSISTWTFEISFFSALRSQRREVNQPWAVGESARVCSVFSVVWHHHNLAEQ